MKRLWVYVWLFFSAGCATIYQPVLTDCDIITAAPLRTLMQMNTAPPNPVHWIAKSFGLEYAEIEKIERKAIETDKSSSNWWDIESGTSYGWWGADGIHYWLYISNGIPSAQVRFWRAKPTAGRILECLGPPDRYRARYFFHPPGVNSLIFEMYYPSKGFRATHVYQTTNLKRKRPPQIVAHTPIEEVKVDLSDVSFEEYIRRTITPPELAEMILTESKPWPGNWEAIEIDLGPFLESN